MAAQEIELQYEDHYTPKSDQQEEGVEIPFERINPDTLHNLIAEFVTRQWEELGDSGGTLEDKIRQVMVQLAAKKAKVVFDLASQSANIVVS